jgi:hypothetical protein
MRQSWRLAEVRCEDYAFVLLSRFAGRLEEQARVLRVCCVCRWLGVFVR